MTAPQPVEPVKLFVAMLWSDASAREAALDRLAERFGAVDFAGPDHPFDATDYYATEMGTDLQRRLIALGPLVSPEILVAAKLFCNELEGTLAGGQGRRVNLDVGYLDHNKIVLASAKAAGQKIYLSRGIYADLVARYAQGRYQPFPWTFPDFKEGRYDGELATIRTCYLQQLREHRNGYCRSDK